MDSKVYVTGHKNPDTDSIVSAIAYAAYKQHFGVNAIPCRLGSTPPETEYLLERFGFEDPRKIYTAKSSLHDIETDSAALVPKELTMKEALDKVMSLKNRGLIVSDSEGHMTGMVTLDDLTYMWTRSDEELEKIIRTIKTLDILKTLEGRLVMPGTRELSGKMHMFPTQKSHVEQGSIAVLRNEDDKLLFCLEQGAAMLIVVTSSPISQQVKDKAEETDAEIIVTELSPLTVTRLIYLTPSIEQVMMPRDKVVCFTSDVTVAEAERVVSQSRFRAYPVLDRRERVVGSISRYHLLRSGKKKFILVDHNEKKQTVDDIESGEVLEIVDHHRMGGFESDGVITITTQPVGATATIIAGMYMDNGVPLSPGMAGILLGAIISDTMNLRSPTTTARDRDIAERLEEISGVKADELSAGMIGATGSILNKRLIEIVYDDFKEFSINGNKVGLSQAVCRTREEFVAVRDDLEDYISDACKSGSYDLIISMLTDPSGSGSYLVSAGPRAQVKDVLFPDSTKDSFTEGLVSRKKQLLPAVIKALS